MHPEIVERAETTLVGMDFYGNPTEKEPGWSMGNEIGKLWMRFERFYESNKGCIKNEIPGAGYEVWVNLNQGDDDKSSYIFVGVAVAKTEALPVELVTKVLPAGTYARFTLRGKEIKSNWPQKVPEEWLPAAGYEMAGRFMYEYYDHARFKGVNNEDSELDIYFPVKPCRS